MKEKPIISLKFLDVNENKSSNNLLNSPSSVILESNKNIEGGKIKSNTDIKTSYKEINPDISSNTEEKLGNHTVITRKESEALHMDCLKKYKIYFPKGNVDFIVDMIQNSQKSNDNNMYNTRKIREKEQKLDFKLAKYTFFTGKMKSIMQAQGQNKIEKPDEEVCNRDKNFVLKKKKKTNILRKGLSLFGKKSGE